MSVIVKGMEMPAKCCDCDAETYDESFYGDEFNHACSFMYKGYTGDIRECGRLEECPLRPLPEKYGRLIDADAFKETLEYYIREAGWDVKTNRVLGWVKDEFIDSERTVVESEGDG